MAKSGSWDKPKLSTDSSNPSVRRAAMNARRASAGGRAKSADDEKLYPAEKKLSYSEQQRVKRERNRARTVNRGSEVRRRKKRGVVASADKIRKAAKK